MDSYRENHKELTHKNKLILWSHQKFRRETLNVFIKEVNKIGLNVNYDKRIQPINLIET